MGTSNSKVLQDLSENDLQKFIGNECISVNDPFWESFLSFPQRALTQEDAKLIFEKTWPLFNQLTINNWKTGNFGTLLRVFLARISGIFKDSEEVDANFTSQAINALLISRYFFQHLIHKYPESEIIKQVNVEGSLLNKDTADTETLLERFINTLISVIIGFPVLDSTYALHCECINVLLVLLSIELFTTETITELKIYKAIFESKNSTNLCISLVKRFIDHNKSPHHGGLFLGLSDLMSLLIPTGEAEGRHLSQNAVLLLVVLVNQYTVIPNPYRETLSSVSDDYPLLYRKISSSLEREETTLLLYHLLHRNEGFKSFLLKQPDIETLVVPMLQAIYHANDSSCHHMYMSLIILLILTEDTQFNRRVHDIVLKAVPWYTDRSIGDTTLGGLIILVTTRTVQYNLLKMRDEYLHTNCLAALANMSSQFYNLHPYACQRLVGLFEVLAKTYIRAKQELVAIEKALRIILEVLNSCLANQLVHNPNLIYSLLYNKNIFETFRENPAFQDIICNINQVLEYFISKLESQKEPCTDVDSVLKVIVDSSQMCPTQRLQKFPDLKFKYVEEEKPEEFFIPYVWSLVSEEKIK